MKVTISMQVETVQLFNPTLGNYFVVLSLTTFTFFVKKELLLKQELAKGKQSTENST